MENSKLAFTCKPASRGYLHKVQAGVASRSLLVILALAALLRPVSPQTLALFVELSVGGVLGGGTLLLCSSNPTGVISSYPLLAGVVGASSVLPPQNPVGVPSRPFLVVPALLRRFFDRWYLMR